MAKDAIITIKGDEAEVRRIEIIYNQKLGVYTVGVQGETKTSGGKPIGLDVGVEDFSEDDKIIDDIWNRALSILLKANDLE